MVQGPAPEFFAGVVVVVVVNMVVVMVMLVVMRIYKGIEPASGGSRART